MKDPRSPGCVGNAKPKTGGVSHNLFVNCASIICTCASNGFVLVPGHRSTTDLYLCRLFVPAIYLYLGTDHLYLGTDYLCLGQVSRTILFLKHRYTVHLCLGTTYLYLFGFVLVPFGFVLVPAEAQLICTFSDLYVYLCFEAQVQVTCDLYLCLHAWRECFFCACRHKLCRVTAKLCLPPSVINDRFYKDPGIGISDVRKH